MFIGAIEKASTAKYGIIFAGACGLLGALVLLPVAIIKARKAKAAGAGSQVPDVQVSVQSYHFFWQTKTVTSNHTRKRKYRQC